MTDDRIVISADEYRDLIEGNQRGMILANAMYQNTRIDKYGLTVDAVAMLTVFRAVCPEDYDEWKEEQDERRAGEDAGDDVSV